VNAPMRPTARPVILTFVHHYLPGYRSGGPVRTISHMVAALGDQFDFRIVTADRDARDAEPYPGLPAAGTWVEVGGAQVLYLAPQERSLGSVARLLRQTPHDILYLNSFFDADFTFKPLLARRLGLAPRARCTIAPRGEFSEGAQALGAWKKEPYIRGAQMLGLYRDLTWQASSAHEADDIRRVMGHRARDVRVAIDLPDLTPQAPTAWQPRRPGEPLRVCFLSRVTPKKNLAFAIDIVGKARASIRLDIYGPIHDRAYWSRCEQQMAKLAPSVVTYRGSIEHAAVTSMLGRYDVLFLPTLGENYGHVILEALSAGTPVLISDTTPWRDLEPAGVGWELPLSKPEAFVAVIEQLAAMPADQQLRMRECARRFAEERRRDTTAIDSNRRLFAAA